MIATANTTDSRTYTYFYNPNRSLSATVDEIPPFADMPQGFDLERTTLIARDEAERELRVNEAWTKGSDTTFSYDPAGNLTERRTDGKLVDGQGNQCTDSGAGCTYTGPNATTTEFSFDALNREETMLRSSDGETQSWATSWWPSDELKSRTRMDGGLSADVAALD